MNIHAVITSNGFAIILLLIVITFHKQAHTVPKIDDKLFGKLCWSILILCCIETLSFVFDCVDNKVAYNINKVCCCLSYMFSLLPCLYWLEYAQYKIFQSEKKLKQTKIVGSIGLYILMGLGIANYFIDIFFTISENNVYSRTKFFPISIGIAVVYLLSSVVIILVNRKKISSRLLLPMLSLLIFPLVGIFIQVAIYGTAYIWATTTFSIIIIFLSLQNEAAGTDYLTGLNSRGRLQDYLSSIIHKSDAKIIGIMLDLNKFKKINDTFGHATGDDALACVGLILKSVAKPEDFVSRYAGDEFVIIIRRNTEQEAIDFISKIRENALSFNSMSNKPYELEFSIGYSIYGIEYNDTIDKFIGRIDQEMYKDKNNH